MSTEIVESTTETRFQCRHVFTDGRRCGSPALRAEPFCYYHHTTRRPAPPRPPLLRRQFADVADGELAPLEAPGFTLPPAASLTERSGIQHTIGLVLARIASNELDPRRAGLLLYGLQIASLNLAKHDPVAEAPETVEEITEDPIHGTIAPPAEFIPRHSFSTHDFAALLAPDDEDEYEDDDYDDDYDEEEDESEQQHCNIHASQASAGEDRAKSRPAQKLVPVASPRPHPVPTLQPAQPLLRQLSRLHHASLRPNHGQNPVNRVFHTQPVTVRHAHPLRNHVADLKAAVTIRNRGVNIVRAQRSLP